MRVYPIILVWYLLGPLLAAQENHAGSGPASLLLTETRTYRLDVQELDSEIHVSFAKLWGFADSLPADLLAAIKNSPRLKTSTDELFRDAKGNSVKDSGYIRWTSEDPKGPTALLWYVNGQQRKELLVSVELLLDNSLGQDRVPHQLSFDELKIAVDFKSSTIGTAVWKSIEFPNAAKRQAAARLESSLQVSITGTLTEQTSRSIRGADRLLSEEISGKFNRLAHNEFRNESHHGITLGWLGQPNLRHQLVLLSGGKGAFLYSVSGPTFPLSVMRRQLEQDAWPLVLRGSEYVGSTAAGNHVYRPVEYLLSRPTQ